MRLPEQADRWTWLVVAAYTQLRLARGLLADHKLPWERPRDPGRLTPTRIRRGFRGLATRLGTPASPPKPSKAGPGRPKGSRRRPAARYRQSRRRGNADPGAKIASSSVASARAIDHDRNSLSGR